MLAASAEPTTQFTRRDAGRLFAASAVLVLAMSVILGIDFLPAQPLLEAGRPAPELVQAPRTDEYPSDVLTKQQRDAASAAILPRYDFTSEGAAAVAAKQLRELDTKVAPIDAAFADGVTPEGRAAILKQVLPGLSSEVRATLEGLDAERWNALRTEAARVLETVERAELRDSQVAPISDSIAGRMAGDLNADERALAAALIGPLVAPNSSFSADLTNQAKARAAEDVKPVIKSWEKGETIVRVGDRVDDVAFEAIDYFGVNQGGLDVARLVGFVVLSCLVIGLLLVWTWRFRREFWHRNNVLLLLSLLLLFAVFALKLTAGRAWLPYALPLAAVGMLVTVLLDAGVAMIMTALIAVLAVGRQRHRARARRLRAVRRDRRHRDRAARGTAGGVPPGRRRRVRRERRSSSSRSRCWATRTPSGWSSCSRPRPRRPAARRSRPSAASPSSGPCSGS